MRRVLLLFAAFSCLSWAGSSAAADQPARVVHSHTLVQLNRGVGPQTAARLRSAGARLVSPTLRVWRIRSAAARRITPSLWRAGSLKRVAPDISLEPAGHITSGDPLLPSEWWVPVIGADRVEPPGPGRPIVVIDGGVDVSHPEFAGRPATSVLNQQTTGRDEFHGTAVASVAAAPANGVGLVGVYPQADLRSWDASPGEDLSAGALIEGIDTGSRSCPGVLNLSVGSDRSHPVLEEAIQLAVERGCLVVAASGNSRTSGSPLIFPASLPHVLTVGSTDRRNSVSFFSNASPALDLAAPGEEMPAAVPFATTAFGYAEMDGTSFSAPLVSGASAWVWTVRGLLDDTQIFELMRRSARDVGAPGRDADTGFGILDLPNALTAAIPPVDPDEPNEDIQLVRPNGLSTTGKPVLRGNRTLAARLDAAEDPRDVYRIFVPGRRTVTVATRGNRDVNLQLWRGRAASVVGNTQNRLAVSSRAGLAIDTVRFRNRSRGGVYVYANVFLGPGAGEASYSLTSGISRP